MKIFPNLIALHAGTVSCINIATFTKLSKLIHLNIPFGLQNTYAHILQ